MIHLFQPVNEGSCGQHVVAMILNTTFDDVFYLFGHRHGTYTRELVYALRQRGVKVKDRLTNVKNGLLPPFCIVSIKGAFLQNNEKYKKYSHWAIYKNGYIHCSCRGIYPVCDLIDGDITSYLEIL